MTDQKKNFHKPLGINKNEKKADKLRDQVKDNLNRFVKDEKLSKAELSIFDKLVSRKNFLVGTAKISALAALVGKGLMPSAFAAENKNFQLSNDDYKDIDPQLLSQLQIPAKIVPSADVMDNQILVKDFEDIPNACDRECVIESLNTAVRVQETANVNDSSMAGLNDLNRSYGVPEIAQLSPNNDKIILNEYNPEGGTGYLRTEIELDNKYENLTGFNGEEHNSIKSSWNVLNKKALIGFTPKKYVSLDNYQSLMKVCYQDTTHRLQIPGRQTESAVDDKWENFDPIMAAINDGIFEIRERFAESLDEICIDYFDIYKSEVDRQFAFGMLSLRRGNNERTFLKIGFTIRFQSSSWPNGNPFSINWFTINIEHYKRMSQLMYSNWEIGMYDQYLYPLCMAPGNPNAIIFNWYAYDFSDEGVFNEGTRGDGKYTNYPIVINTGNWKRLNKYDSIELTNVSHLEIINDTRLKITYPVDNKLQKLQNNRAELINLNYVDEKHFKYNRNAHVIHPKLENGMRVNGFTSIGNASHLIEMANGLVKNKSLAVFGNWDNIYSGSSETIGSFYWPRTYFHIQTWPFSSQVTLTLNHQDILFENAFPKGFRIEQINKSKPLITKNHQGLFQYHISCNLKNTSSSLNQDFNNALLCYREEGEKRHESPFPQTGDPIDGSRKNGIIFTSTFKASEQEIGIGNNIVDNGIERILNWSNYLNFAESVVLHNILMEQSNRDEKHYNYSTQDYIENNWQSQKLQIQVTAEERVKSQHIVKKPLHTVELHLLNTYNRPVVTDPNTYVEIRLADQAYVRDSTDPTNLAYQKANRYQSFLAKPIAGKVVLDINLGDDNRDLGRGTTLMYRILHTNSLQINSQNTQLTSPLLKFDLSRNDANIFEFQSFNISYKLHKRMAEEYATGKSNTQMVDDHKMYQNIANDTSQQGGGSNVTQKYSIQDSLLANYSSDNPYNTDKRPEVDDTIKSEMINGPDPKIQQSYSKLAEASKPKEQLCSNLLFQNAANIAVVNPLTCKLGYNHSQALQAQLGISFNPIDWIKDALRLLKKAIQAAIDFIKKTIKAVLDSIANVMDMIGLHGLGDAIRFLETAINSILTIICDFITLIIDLVIALLDLRKILAISKAMKSLISPIKDIHANTPEMKDTSSRSAEITKSLQGARENQNSVANTLSSPEVRAATNDKEGQKVQNSIRKNNMSDSSSSNQFTRHIANANNDTNKLQGFYSATLTSNQDEIGLLLKQTNMDKISTDSKYNLQGSKISEANTNQDVLQASRTAAPGSLMTNFVDIDQIASQNGGDPLSQFINPDFISKLHSGFLEIVDKPLYIPLLSEILQVLGSSTPSVLDICCFVTAAVVHFITEILRTLRLISQDFDMENALNDLRNALSGNRYQNGMLNNSNDTVDTLLIINRVIGYTNSIQASIWGILDANKTPKAGLLDVGANIASIIQESTGYAINLISGKKTKMLDIMIIGTGTAKLCMSGMSISDAVPSILTNTGKLCMDILTLGLRVGVVAAAATKANISLMINQVFKLIKSIYAVVKEVLDLVTRNIIAVAFILVDFAFIVINEAMAIL